MAEDDTRIRYQEELRAKLDQVEIGTSKEEAWTNQKANIRDTTREVVSPKYKGEGWFGDEGRAAVKEHEKARARTQQSSLPKSGKGEEICCDKMGGAGDV